MEIKYIFSLLLVVFTMSCASATSEINSNQALAQQQLADQDYDKATLIGTRRKGSLDSEYVQITFKESSIVMANSGKEPRELTVRYIDLDNSFGIEILNDKGDEQAALMAMFQRPNKIK